VTRFAVLAILVLVAAAPATAGPPYVTDDPVPTDRGHWEIYHFVAGTRADSARGGEAGIDLNYGAADDLQLTAVLPLAYQQDPATRIGRGTVELAAKYRFLNAHEGSSLADVAFFPRVFLASAADGLGPRRTQLLLPVWVGRDLGTWSVFGGGGYQINPGDGNRDFWTAGLAVTHAATRDITLGAEIYGRSADAIGGRALVAANLGLAFALGSRWSLLASLGPGLEHARAEGPYAFYLALKADY
jgi:hypothetical protein